MAEERKRYIGGGVSRERMAELTGARRSPGQGLSKSNDRGPVGGSPIKSFGAIPGPRNVRTGAMGMPTGGDVQMLEPQIRNPLLSASNFQLPQTSLELNQWIRYFDRFHPTVGNAIDMHATVPFSKFDLTGIQDTAVLRYYEDMANEMNLFRHILEISREYELMGEAFPFLIWDDEMGGWCDAMVLNPDYIEVHGVKIGGKKGLRYELALDNQVRQFIMSPDPLDQEIVSELDPAIIQAAQTGLNTPLDPFNFEHLMRPSSPYDTRGTSIVLGCLKDLLYEEQLREAQYAIAGGITRPREIWKLGTQGEWMPTEGDLNELRELLAASRYDPNFALVSHYGLSVDFVGAERRILPVAQEFQMINERILTRLYTSKAMTGGEGPTYQNSSVAMTVLDARYSWKRDFIIDYLERKVFLPVALENEFREPLSSAELEGGFRTKTKADRPPMIPKLKWLSKVNLTDRNQQMGYLVSLYQQGGLPLKMIADVFQMDYNEIVAWMKRERGTIADPAVSAAYKARVQAAAMAKGTAQGGGSPGGPTAPGGGGIANDADDVADEVKDNMEQDEKAVTQQVTKQQQVQQHEDSKSNVKPPKVGEHIRSVAEQAGPPRRSKHRVFRDR